MSAAGDQARRFGITLTKRGGGTFMTADHGELDKIAAAGICSVTFIR